MTRAEFDEALDLARDGRIRTDIGADDRIAAALYAIAAGAPDPRPELIEAAYDAFARRA